MESTAESPFDSLAVDRLSCELDKDVGPSPSICLGDVGVLT